jgi:hypothetical protein
VEQMVLLQRQNPKITQEDLDRLGEFLFNALAINRKDIKIWNLAQQIRIKRQGQLLQKKAVENATRKMKLEWRKYKDEKAKTGKAAKASDETGMSPVEKKAAVRRILGIS